MRSASGLTICRGPQTEENDLPGCHLQHFETKGKGGSDSGFNQKVFQGFSFFPESVEFYTTLKE
jgi:hypothetical protein